jgi:hypothetical protein
MRRLFNLLLLLLVFLLACAVDDYFLGEEQTDLRPNTTLNHGPSAQNRGVTNFWVGRNVSKLVAVRGEPNMILDARPRSPGNTGSPNTVCYLYSSKAGSGGGCMDAYVVDLESGIIVRYHCR